MTLCPKCVGCFLPGWDLCEDHQKEYDQWMQKEYFPIPCQCGNDDWKAGSMQMTTPPTLPLMDVWLCTKCEDVGLEKSDDGTHRIRQRK